MKKTYPTNIDGQIFYIDEDAFELLNSYIDQLRQTFHGDEGREIVADIESRIRELFTERINAGAGVIVMADVNNVIATMGRPEDLGEEADESTANTNPQQTSRPFVTFNLPGHKRLYRNMKDKVFGGVFGGIASYLNWNPNIMRLLFVLILLMSCSYKIFLPLIILYLIAWMIIPAATTPKDMLAMKGEPVNVDTVGQAVIDNAPNSQDNNTFATICDIIGKMIMALMGLFAGCVVICCLIGFIGTLTGLVAYAFAGPSVLAELTEIWPYTIGWHPVVGSLLGVLGILLLFGLMAWGAFSVVFNFRGVPKATTWIIIAASIMLIIASIAIIMVGLNM